MDKNRFIILIIILLIANLSFAETPTWDLTDQDCDAFDGNWTQNNVGTGTVATATEDTRTVYKFVCPWDVGNNPYAVNLSLSAWTECTAEFVFKIGNGPWDYDGNARISLYMRDQDRYEYSARIQWFDSKTYPYIRLGSGDTSLRQWIDITSNDWHTVRVVIDSSHNLWGWVDGQYIGKLAYSGDVSVGLSANTIGLAAYSSSVNDSDFIVYVDSVKMSSSKAEPDYHGLVNIQGSGNVNCRIASLGSGGAGMPIDPVNPADKVRIHLDRYTSGGISYALPLVDTTDDYASKVRVYDGSSVKAVQKMPDF